MPAPTKRLLSEVVDGVTVVSLLDARIVDEVTLFAVRDAIYKFVEENKPSRLVVNLINVQNYSSPLLGYLLAVKKKLKQFKGVMKTCCIAPDLMEAVKILHLDRELDVYLEEQAAVDAF